MRKAILFVLCCSVVLSGCSAKGKPKDMPQETYEVALKLADDVQDYIDGKSGLNVLDQRVDTAFENVMKIHDSLSDTSEIAETIKVVNDITAISNTVTEASTAWLTEDSTDTTKELEKRLKDLKKDIGE